MRGGSNAKISRHRNPPSVSRRVADLPAADFDVTVTPGELPESVRELYGEIVTDLSKRGLKQLDLHQLRNYCWLLHIAELAQQDIAQNGLTVDTLNGPRPNPAIRHLKDANAQSLRIAEQYGLTLGARLRMGIADSGWSVWDFAKNIGEKIVEAEKLKDEAAKVKPKKTKS